MPFASLDGINVTALLPGLQRVQLLKPDLKVPKLPSDIWTFEVTAPNVRAVKPRSYFLMVQTYYLWFNFRYHQ